MKNDKKKLLSKKFGNDLIKQLYKIDGVISVTIVGSFVGTYNLDKVGDLDVIIVCKNITAQTIQTSKNIIKKINSKYSITKKKLKINDTFGPIKYDSAKYFTVHMMVYDIRGHIEHAINSPFTCYDWQRSNWFIGKKLEKVFPVQNIYLRDFFEARRGSNEYLRDLKKNNISIRKYQINKERILIRKINYKINNKNRGEFVFHIINNLINNYNKFDKTKNVKLSTKNFYKLFLKITKNDKYLLNAFNKLKKQKINLANIYHHKSINLAEKFLKYFNSFLKKERMQYKEIIFLRHAKTSLNNKTFLGQGRNPDILKKIKFMEKYDLIYSSQLKRSISTAKLYKGKKFIINKYLNEINYGKAEGMSLNDYCKKYPKKIRLWKRSIDTRFPYGENTKDVNKRFIKFIKKEIPKHTSKKNINKILVVGHNVFLRCLVGYFLKVKFKNYFKVNIKHMQKFNFIFKHNKIYPDFKRIYFKKLLEKLYD